MAIRSGSTQTETVYNEMFGSKEISPLRSGNPDDAISCALQGYLIATIGDACPQVVGEKPACRRQIAGAMQTNVGRRQLRHADDPRKK